MNPLISVITITYNAESTVPPTLESLRRQSFRDFEHVVIDGASSDGTIALIRENGIEGARILSERDNGLYYAMNKGLEMARGEYVVFLNAGDAFHSDDTLQAYADAAALNDPDIIYGDTVIVDSQRRLIAPRHLSAPEVLTFKSFSKGMLICHQAFMVKREIAPLYNTDYRFSSDYDWTIRCILATCPVKCTNLHRVTIDYLSEGLTDKNHFKSLRERYRIMRSHYGSAITLSRHMTFVFRAFSRKLRKK